MAHAAVNQLQGQRLLGEGSESQGPRKCLGARVDRQQQEWSGTASSPLMLGQDKEIGLERPLMTADQMQRGGCEVRDEPEGR